MKAVWKGGSAYGLSNALAAGTQFATILVFAGALRPDDFGHLSMFSVLYILLSMIIGLGLSAAAQHAYFQITYEKFKILISTILKVIICFALLIALLIALVPYDLLKYASLPRVWVIFAVATASAQTLVQIFLTILQTQGKLSTYLKVSTFQITLQLIFPIGFLLLRRQDWQLAVLAQSASPIFVGGMVFLILFKEGYIKRGNSIEPLVDALRYSWPLVLHQVAAWVISMVDRFIIASHFGVAEAGVYSLSFQIAQAVNIISNSLNQAMVPVMFRLLAKKPTDQVKIRRLNLLYAIALLVSSTIFLLAFLAFAPLALSSYYQPAIKYTPWLICSFFLLAVSRISANFLLYYRRTFTLAISTILSALLSLLLNLLLIPRFGLTGACWASVVSFCVLLVITTWQAQKCFNQQLSKPDSN